MNYSNLNVKRKNISIFQRCLTFTICIVTNLERTFELIIVFHFVCYTCICCLVVFGKEFVFLLIKKNI